MRVGGACVLAALLCLGCEDDDYLDHNPPPGQGSLIIDNRTSIDFDLFVDGEFTTEVKDGRERVLDLSPGIYRVVLDSDDDFYGSFREDIDILEGRLTILRIYPEFSGPSADYTVTIDID